MLWWGSYSTVYVPPPLCVFPIVLMLHIPSSFFYSMFCVLISSFICAPEFSFLPFVCFLHAWMKTFRGCGCICTICSHMCVLKCVYLTYFAIVVTIGQDSSVKHVILIMCVNWHVISLASLFLYVSVGHIVCHFCIFVIFHMYHF